MILKCFRVKMFLEFSNSRKYVKLFKSSNKTSKLFKRMEEPPSGAKAILHAEFIRLKSHRKCAAATHPAFSSNDALFTKGFSTGYHSVPTTTS
jgi:hypothetical protein